MEVELLVEGFTDEIFVRECYRQVGIEVSDVFGKRGVDFVSCFANGYAQRGRYSPILILADFMDVQGSCPPEASALLVSEPQPRALVAFAVNEVEAWLLASRKELASYLSVSMAHVPDQPDIVVDPKLVLVNIARRSWSNRIKDMFVPKPGISAPVGTGYVDGFAEFVKSRWSITSARASSPSLDRFVRRSRELFA